MGMIVVVAEVIVSVRPTGHLQFADFARITQLLQVPVHRFPADRGMILCNILIDLVCSGIVLQPIHGRQYKAAPNRFAMNHVWFRISYQY